MSKDTYLERFFNSKKSTPDTIKKEYEDAVKEHNQPGIHVIKDDASRYTAVCKGGEQQTTYMINEYSEAIEDGFPARTTEYLYETPEKSFVKVEEHVFSGDKVIKTYNGFTLDSDGKVVNFNAEQAKVNFEETNSIIQKVFETQQTANVPTEG